MQADNLTKRDAKEMEKFFKEHIQLMNPDAKITAFLMDKFKQKDCLFKDKCKKSEVKDGI